MADDFFFSKCYVRSFLSWFCIILFKNLKYVKSQKSEQNGG